MFLHLGNGVSVRMKKVIAIQDYAVFQSGPGKRLLEKQQRRGKVISALEPGQIDDGEGTKSLILTEENIYLSAISPLTLKRRSELAFYRTGLSETAEKTMEASDAMRVN